MYLEVKEISMTKEMEKKTVKDKYPESGFYLVTREEIGNTDLVFADRSGNYQMMICPKTVFDGIQYLAVNPDHHKNPQVLATNEVIPPQGYASEQFILDFTKVLLKQK